MVASEHPELIEGRARLIAKDVLDSEEESEYGSIDNDGADPGEEDGSGLGEAGVIIGVTQSGTEEVEDVQRVMKYSSLSSYMLKPTYLLTQGFNENKKAEEKLFMHMRNFGARAEWRNGRISVSSYLDVNIRNDQYRLVNPIPFNCITGYIMDVDICDRSLKSLT